MYLRLFWQPGNLAVVVPLKDAGSRDRRTGGSADFLSILQPCVANICSSCCVGCGSQDLAKAGCGAGWATFSAHLRCHVFGWRWLDLEKFRWIFLWYPSHIPVISPEKIRYPFVGWLWLRMSRILTMTYGEVLADVAIVYPFPGRIFLAIQILMFRLDLIGKPQISTTKRFQLQPT